MKRAILLTTLLANQGDTTAPTVVITCDQSSPTPVSPLTFTVTFSEDVTGFEVADFGITNGTKGTFTPVSATVYTLSVVPNALATVTATIAAGVCQDASGNLNTEATPLAIVSTAIVVDDFTDIRSAGAINGTSATPGPGVRLCVDVSNKLSIDGSDLVCAGGKAVPAVGDPGIWWNAVTRSPGICAIACLYPAATTIGFLRGVVFDGNQSGDTVDVAFNLPNFGYTNAKIGAANFPDFNGVVYAALNDVYLAIVQRSAGYHLLLKGGGSHPDWERAWVTLAGITENLYPGVLNYDKVFNVDYFRVAQLGAPWTAPSADGTIIASPAVDAVFRLTERFLIYLTVTLTSSGNIEVHYKIQDATNFMRILISSAGAYSMAKVVDGTPSTLLSGTGVTNGMRVGIRVLPLNLGTWFHKGDITGASYSYDETFMAEVDGKIADLGTGGAITSLEIYPYYIGGDALTELTAMNHATFKGFQVNSATMANASSRLTIPNGETGGNANQVVHPDVVRPNPTGKWNGYTYWMVINPYPESDESKENPWIVVSDDMETWIEPPGIINPVVAAPETSHNADPDLFYDADLDTLYLAQLTPDGLSLTSSIDGITWAAQATIIAGFPDVSPSIAKKGDGTFEIYSIYPIVGQEVCRVRTCATIDGTWSSPTTCFTRSPYSDPQNMWHLDVYLENGNYLAMITVHDTGDYMWLASSTDGRRWHIADTPLMYKSVSGWDNKWIYRGSVGIRTATGFDVIYSAKSDAGAGDWGAGRTQLTIPLV